MLITLGIIGVVAAMTMPTLVAKYQEKETVTKLKKFNSVMSQAFQKAVADLGEISEWGLGSAGTGKEETDEEIQASRDNVRKFFNIIIPYLKTTSTCLDKNAPCVTANTYARHSLDGTEFSNFSSKVILADGTSIVGVTILDPQCDMQLGTTKALQNICGQLFIDLNSKKPPNATGKDIFLFYYNKFGAIIPQGTPAETENSFAKRCNLSKTHILNGYGCAAWIIYNENMDYLHCDDLSWDGKKKCN